MVLGSAQKRPARVFCLAVSRGCSKISFLPRPLKICELRYCEPMIGRKRKEPLTIIVELISAVGTENFTLLTSKPSPSHRSRARVGVHWHPQLFVLGDFLHDLV